MAKTGGEDSKGANQSSANVITVLLHRLVSSYITKDQGNTLLK